MNGNSMNAFIGASHRFSNQESSLVSVVQFRCTPVQGLLSAISDHFRPLDFADEFQAELGRNLWRLRCLVLFGLAPYDDKELALLQVGETIASMSDRLPGARESSEQLMERLLVLLEQPGNPKLDWILKQNWGSSQGAAVFAPMALRKCFGSDLLHRQPRLPEYAPSIIHAVDEIEAEDGAMLIVPGTCRYLSQALFIKIFHLGRFSGFTVLLHEGESFSPKPRLRLPDCRMLDHRASTRDLKIERLGPVVSDSDDQDDDKRMSDGLFGAPTGVQGLAGQGVPARYLLCDDGKGFYVAENERIRVWRPQEDKGLVPVYPVELQESDFVVLESTNRSELLDQADDRGEFKAGLDSTESWRAPLKALLLSRSLDDIASQMANTGYLPDRQAAMTATGDSMIESAESMARTSRNLKSLISNWANGTVYGPRDEAHLQALVQVLVNEGKLEMDRSVDTVAEEWFADLEALRAGRRATGRRVQEEVSALLEKVLSESEAPEDGKEIELSNGMVVCLRQLSMIGDKITAVPESKLNRPI